MQNAIVEWAPFKLKNEATEAMLLAASQELQDNFLSRQKGYAGRQLLRGTDGGYVDLVWWESDATAQAAMAEAMKSEVCAAYFAIMEAPDGGVLHFKTVKRY